jgi:hypothetical protein
VEYEAHAGRVDACLKEYGGHTAQALTKQPPAGPASRPMLCEEVRRTELLDEALSEG